MKYTVLVTQRCNLACPYCYIGQRKSRITSRVMQQVVDFAYRMTPPEEKLEIGFFGGEPLLEFDRVRELAERFEAHPDFTCDRVLMTVVSNGTVFTPRIASWLLQHAIGLGVSCDGPPHVQDAARPFHNGKGSSARVERTVRLALAAGLPVMVNAVYGPATLAELPATVEYLSSLGLRQIYLNPDFTAEWSAADLERLPTVFAELGRLYVSFYRARDPHFLSPIDSKISVMLRDGYDPLERCRMGRGEFAFTPEGRIYPCERLVGDGVDGHAIGDLETGIRLERMLCRRAPGEPVNRECLACSLKEHCMNWCGCSNFFSSGYYNRVSPFLCASEKAAIRTALAAFQELERDLGGLFFEHLAGAPQVNSLLCRGGGAGS